MNSKLHSKLRFWFLAPCLIIGSIKAQNVTVAGATVGDGTYATLGAAFTAINGGAQTNATIAVSITGNTTEPGTATLNASDWKSLTISPTGGTPLSISGNVANALIHLNGATNVTIDGLNTGGNLLTLDNTATGATSTILFNNGCKSVLVQNCMILGSSSMSNNGTLSFGTASGGGIGNSLIKVQSCTIDASSGGNPVNGVYSSGSIIPGQENSNDTIVNSFIANYFNPDLSSSGILLNTGNTNWDISGCRFYQNATRTYTTGNIHSAIHVMSGNGYSVTNNIIGFANYAGTGVYTMDGTVATRFIGINLSVGATTASSVQGNIISAISLATSSGSTTDIGILCGISASAGNVNIGNIAANIIGGNTGVDLITAIPSTTQGTVVGIHSGSTGEILIQNNSIGGITSSSLTPAIGGGLYGIHISAVASSLTITGNTIGNATADNMRAGILATTTSSSVASGIYFSTTPATSSITKNTIQNLSAYGTQTASFVRGICTASANSNSSPINISGNIINKLKSNSSLPGIVSGQCAAAGITLSIGTNDVISENVISDIALIGTSATNSYAVGIGHANGTNSTISNNKIFNITNASTSVSASAPGVAAGIAIRSADGNLNVYNNMISLGTGSANNTAFVGIHANHGFTPVPTVDNIYYNTVNIAGTATTGAQPSFCFLRGDFSTTERTAPVTIKNNIFINSRTGGTGSHFALGNNYGTATPTNAGWVAKASNYNLLNANAATIGWWTTNHTFASWQAASAGDSTSFSGYPVTFADPVSDLHVTMGTTPTVIESGGVVIPAVTTDIDGETRPGPAGSVNGGGLAPDLGADEIDAVKQDITPPTISYTVLPESCDTLDRMLTVAIVDAGGIPVTGILQPKIYYHRNNDAWVSSQGSLSSGTANNGTWSFPILKSNLAGLTAGDSVSYFVIAQDLSGVLAYSPSAGVVATDVNTVTSYPTAPNKYHIKAAPMIRTTTPASVCDSGAVTLAATATTGILNWYTLPTGGVSQGTGATYTTPVIKNTTSYYVDATDNGCTTLRSEVVATVNHSTPGTLTTTVCDSLKWNNKLYTISGTYVDTILTVKGCDSIVTINLTVNHSSSSTQTMTACDMYMWQGMNLTATGVYKDTIPNMAGCDSIMVLNLTIKNSTTSTETATACDNYTWNNMNLTASGIYKDTIPNSIGCDSIMILNLTINHSTNSSQTISACSMYMWQGMTLTTSGTYHDTIPNKVGCDSIMVLNLTVTHVNPTVTVNMNTITADSVADSYQWIDCNNGNQPIAGAVGQAFTATVTGNYAVIETTNGCIDTSKCEFILVTGIDKTGKEAITFYPNPGTGLYTITLPEQSQIKIVNVRGEVIFDNQFSKGSHTIDLLEAAKGVYLMQVYTNKTVDVLKLIKQ
jgi:hypothetical protein